ncbi:MAG: DUF6089 family protein [Flammeovirgaceae bacterium]
MKKLSFVVVCAVLLSTLSFDSYSQLNRKAIKRNNKRMASFRGKKRGFGRQNVYSGVGISLNALNNFGDLAPLPRKFSTDISFTSPSIGISLYHRFGPRYTLQAQYMYGAIKGSDAESADRNDKENGQYRALRNASFRNRMHELSVVAYFDLFENQSTYISRVKWTPYVFAGGALFYHNPQAQAPATDLQGNPLPQAGQWVDLQPLGTEGQYSDLAPGDANFGIKPYSLLQFSIPFGIGARFRINEVFDLWADIGFRYTFTDYLDDVSANYTDIWKIKAKDPALTPLAQAMAYRTGEVVTDTSDPNLFTTYNAPDGKTYRLRNGYGTEYPTNNRGNRNNNDIIMVTSVKLTYILGATFHKAKFR